jgi:diguanylate cyclase (GGDEF)-like protein
MTVLFGIMMAVILLVIVIFNIFIFRMLQPLNRLIKTIIQILSDWELSPQTNSYQKGEIETLGEFFYMTIIDQLTGIYNRRYFDGNLKKIIKSHSRTNSTFSLLMLDIDFFKNYNDTYGHDAGDNCLRTIAVAIAKCITRDEDFVARYGGEEFVVVLPNTDINGVNLIAKKILEKVCECRIPNEASDIADYVTISIGGTTGVVKHLQSGSDYIKCADKALYESKKNGRNKYTFVDFAS